MNGYRIKIVHNLEKGYPPMQKTVMEAACTAVEDLVATEVYTMREGAVLILEDIDHVYKLLTKNAQEILKSHNLRALQPE